MGSFFGKPSNFLLVSDERQDCYYNYSIDLFYFCDLSNIKVLNGGVSRLVSIFSSFSELINMAVPDTIDNRAINKTKNGKISLFKKHENLTLAINSAKVT